MSTERFVAELREQLLVAAEQVVAPQAPVRRRWPRRAALGAVAAALVMVVAGLMTVRDTSPVAADVEVIREGDHIIVRLTDLNTRPAEIVAAAREAGIDLRVVEVPVGPSNVGRFILGPMSERPPELVIDDPNNGAFSGFRLPVDWDGTLVLLLGRPAADGESYVVSSDPTAAGESAECADLLGRSAGEVESDLTSRGLSVRTFVLPTPGEVENLGEFASWPVVRVEATSASDVIVTVMESSQIRDPDGTAGTASTC